MKKWEYSACSMSSREVVSEMGEKGWELVSVVYDPTARGLGGDGAKQGEATGYFKREIRCELEGKFVEDDKPYQSYLLRTIRKFRPYK